MAHKILPILVLCLIAMSGCSGEKGKQQLETALFEEKQNNNEHAIKLYEEIISKYPKSPHAITAKEHLNRLKTGK